MRDISPTEMVIRDIVVLSTLSSDTMSASDLSAEYPMTTKEDMIPDSTMRDILDRLQKARLIRYASSNGSEIHPKDLESGVKYYSIAAGGKEMLDKIRSIGRRCGLILTESDE